MTRSENDMQTTDTDYRKTAACKLLDVGEVAELLGCSARHVYRLADAGRMPAPVRVGALIRWPQPTRMTV